MPLTRQEINRKLFHLFALLLPIGIFYVPKLLNTSLWVPPIVLAFLLITILAIEKLRFSYPEFHKRFSKMFESMLRKEEAGTMTGSTWYIASALLCSVLFVYQPHISFMALALFITGDAAAAIVGQSIGKIKIGKKSLEGSLACFGSSVVLMLAVFPLTPLVLDIWNGSIPFLLILTTSAVITVFELFPIKISKFVLNDNLIVPVIGGFVLKYLYSVFV